MVLSARRRSFVYNLSGLGSNYPNSPRQGYNIGPASGGAETLSDLYYEQWIPANEMIIDGTAVNQPTPGTRQETTLQSAHYDYLEFADAASEYGYFNVTAPEDFDASSFALWAMWESPATTGKNVVWSVAIIGINDGESTDDPNAPSPNWEAAGVVETDSTSANYLNSYYIGTLSHSNGEAKLDHVMFRFGRLGSDGSDNLANVARLIGIGVQWHGLAANNAQWS